MKTIRELSGELRVSKQSVWNEIDRQGLRSKLSKDGQTFTVDDETEELIKSAFQKRQTVKRQDVDRQVDGKVADKLPSSVQDDLTVDWQRLMIEKDSQIAEKDRQIASLLASVERLQEQAEETARQHAETVQRLTEALNHTSAALDVAQRLHAGTIAQQIESKEEPLPITPEVTPDREEPRRHWWQFWK